MAYILDRMKPLLRYIEVKAAEKKEAENEERKKSRNIWPRLLVFSPSSNCEEDDEENENEKKANEECDDSQMQSIKYKVEIKEECEEDMPSEDECDSDEDDNSFFKGIPACMYHGAKYGLKDGALTGIFLGGCFGLCKYITSEKNDDSSDDESTLNNNVIFVTAANCAIAMAVFATVFCSTKAAFFCN